MSWDKPPGRCCLQPLLAQLSSAALLKGPSRLLPVGAEESCSWRGFGALVAVPRLSQSPLQPCPVECSCFLCTAQQLRRSLTFRWFEWVRSDLQSEANGAGCLGGSSPAPPHPADAPSPRGAFSPLQDPRWDGAGIAGEGICGGAASGWFYSFIPVPGAGQGQLCPGPRSHISQLDSVRHLLGTPEAPLLSISGMPNPCALQSPVLCVCRQKSAPGWCPRGELEDKE